MAETNRPSRYACFFLSTLLSASPHPIKREVALIVRIFLSINREDLAKEECEGTKKQAEEGLQLIESTINLVSGKEAHSDSNWFYIEQLANPSLSSTRVLTAQGATRLLRGEVGSRGSCQSRRCGG